jgi:rhodanese-related sulfurtransferase
MRRFEGGREETMRPYILQTLAVVAIAAIAGLAWNQFAPAGISIMKCDPIPDAKKAAVQLDLPRLDLAAAKTEFDQGVIFVDARTPADFSSGRIPGALNVPELEIPQYFPEFQALVPPSERVIVYCDGQECLASIKVAEHLRKEGYQKVEVFFGGWQQWVGAAYPVEWD